MSKFFNYVKKFLSLSFMSVVAAFSLSFNQVSAKEMMSARKFPTVYSSIRGTKQQRLPEWISLDRRASSAHGQGFIALQMSPVSFFGSPSDSHAQTYTDSESSNVYFIKNSENASDETPREAIWIGNLSTEKVSVPAGINSSDDEHPVTPVTGARLGENLGVDEQEVSAVKELTLDATNYADGIENIIVKNIENVPSLTKIVISNLNRSNLAETGIRNNDLTKLLARNSLTGTVAWYNSEDNGKLVGESNLSWGKSHGGRVHVSGADFAFDPISGTWNLVSLSNQSTAVIPASFVDEHGHLKKVEGLDLSNGIKTDKIEKIIITNIQDDDQREKIMKCAKLVLSGLENGLNDDTDWALSSEQSGDKGILIFEKVQRSMKSIILDVITDYQNWIKDQGDRSLSPEEKLEQFEKILDKHCADASEHQTKLINILKSMLNSLKENGTLEIVNNMQTRLKEIINSIAQGNEYPYSGLKDLNERVEQIIKELESGYSDENESSYSEEDEDSYSNEDDFSSDESSSSETGNLSLESGTDNSSLTRPDPQNVSESSDASEGDQSSVSGSSDNKNNSSNTVLGSSNETNDNVSKLTTVLQDWQNWLVGDGADKNAKEKYQELKNMINAQMDSLSTEEKEEAKKLIKEIDDALADIDSASSSSTGSSTGTASTSTYSSTPSSSSSNSAQTKTSDSYVSPELLSLILSGSLAGLSPSMY